MRILLTPLYEELGPVAQENEEKWKENLRSLARTFLCRAGYRPCIEEAQVAYHKWMDSENPNDGNPLVNFLFYYSIFCINKTTFLNLSLNMQI